MSITLRPMSVDRLPAWLDDTNAAYIEELVAAGRTREDAIRHAAKSMEFAFPDGELAPGHAVFDVLDDAEERVGYLWIGPDTSEDPAAWWVWDIEIDEGQRGHGYGRATMLLGEDYARRQGARTLGLNVFGSNSVARGLYERLGYATTQLQMRKPLTPEDD
jgi:ribosomal protein S18 acetylase RimI-like enzyme